MSLLERIRRRLGPSDGPIEQSPPLAPAEPAPKKEPTASVDIERVRESLNLLEADLRELIARVGRAAEQVHEGVGSSTKELDAIRRSTGDLSGLVEEANQNVSVLAGATEE